MPGSRNRGFGDRIKNQRNYLGLKRNVVARLAGIPFERLKVIEAEQLDEADLVQDQLNRLADILKCSLEWLVGGTETHGVALPANVVAQRSNNRPIQTALSFEDQGLSLSCPRCLQPARGSRCSNCGHFLE